MRTTVPTQFRHFFLILRVARGAAGDSEYVSFLGTLRATPTRGVRASFDEDDLGSLVRGKFTTLSSCGASKEGIHDP